MRDRFTRIIESSANVAIIIVAILVAIALIRTYLLGAPPQQRVTNATPPSEGSQIPGLDINWQASEQTLVLAISSSCHFCTESAPFYKKLISGKRNMRVIAVLPQPIDEGKAYLNRLGIVVDEVKQLSLESIGVRGTPTLLLIDSSGVVKKSWIGKLLPEEELTVVKTLERT